MLRMGFIDDVEWILQTPRRNVRSPCSRRPCRPIRKVAGSSSNAPAHGQDRVAHHDRGEHPPALLADRGCTSSMP